MQYEIQRDDWKVLRSLHEIALDRFCKGVLDEAGRLCAPPVAFDENIMRSGKRAEPVREGFQGLILWLIAPEGEPRHSLDDGKRILDAV